MTKSNKAKVLEVYPKAKAKEEFLSCTWTVKCNGKILGHGDSAKQAWENAAKQIKRKED